MANPIVNMLMNLYRSGYVGVSNMAMGGGFQNALQNALMKAVMGAKVFKRGAPPIAKNADEFSKLLSEMLKSGKGFTP